MKKSPFRNLAAFVALVPASILGFLLLLNPPNVQPGVKVVGIIDGDTLVLEGKSRVRLRHVDAPEKGLCGSSQATKNLEELTLGKKVRIEEQVPDQYGRGMALTYVDQTLINEEMISSGWVRYHSDISTQTERLKVADALARREKRGIWGSCHSTKNADNPKCTIKGNIDKSTDTHIYYVPGCAQYPFTIVEKDIGEQWFCTEAEARRAGYTKAKTC